MLPYLPHRDTEQQVYLTGSRFTILTNQRLVQLTHLRPIDQLYSLLCSLCETNRSMAFYYDNFLDFAATHTMEETCTMLVQVLADPQGTYARSQRLGHLLNLKRAVVNRESRVHTSATYPARNQNRRLSPKQGFNANGIDRTFYGNMSQNNQNNHDRQQFQNGQMKNNNNPELSDISAVLHNYDLNGDNLS